MKTLIAIILIMLCPVIAYADTSDELAADSLITIGKGCFAGIILQTDGANTTTVNAYDNTTNSGRKLIAEWVVESTSRYQAVSLDLEPCLVRYKTGIYIDITTNGSVKYVVYYLPD
jgi:hypothetical protein